MIGIRKLKLKSPNAEKNGMLFHKKIRTFTN